MATSHNLFCFYISHVKGLNRMELYIPFFCYIKLINIIFLTQKIKFSFVY
jgi:hypothetical protein